MKRMIAALLVLALLLGTAAMAEGTLNVSGTGTVYMEADRVSATLGVRLSGADVAQLQQQANETVNAICADLEAAGLEKKDIATANIYIYPQYDYIDGGEKIVGYTVNNSLSIQTEEIDRIGNLIDIAFAAGANTFDSISFTAEDDSAARKQALELAVQNAKNKAEIIAAAAGKSLGGILLISEGSQGSYTTYDNGPNVAYARTEGAAKDSTTIVRAAQVSVSATVEISYELK